MSTDITWQQHRESFPTATDDGQPAPSSSGPTSVQEWDPTAFLNPSMFSSDLVSSPANATPPQNANHFQLDHHALAHPQLHQTHNGVSQLVNNPSYSQDAFQDQYMHDQYTQQSFNDLFPQSQAPRPPVFEPGRYRHSSSQQQPSDLEPPMAHMGLNNSESLYFGSVPYQQQAQHGQFSQNLAGHFDFSQSSGITPNDRASPNPRPSPFAISPASNHSFAAQQDFPGSIERRPSTADSAHSVHGEYPGEYTMGAPLGPGALNGNGTNGIVPSALHGFNQRNNSGAFHPPIPQEQPNGRPYVQLVPQTSAVNPSTVPFISGQSAYGPPQPPQYVPDQAFHVAPHALDADPNGYPPLNASSPEITRYLRPILQQYIETRNRIGFGERTVIVMASKVAQKSYGQERRFLCPPPTAIMIGNAWWSETALGRDDRRPPRVTVSISGESTPPESTVEWTSALGKPVDMGEAPPEPSPFMQDDISSFQNGGALKPHTQTYIGRAVGKQLFISDERQKKVEALVKIVAQGTEDEPERVIGVFPSKPIKVISKPSKKRQSAKNMELCINHGSTVSLFNRLRAQTVSTKYLCVSGSGSSFKGSDGAPLPGVETPNRGNTPSFVAKIGTWDPFVIYIVDVTKPQGPDTIPPPPVQPDYPAPPPNAIGVMHHGSHVPIYYNQTVVLQCLTSGVVSPVLIIRKVERDTTVVGGGLQEGAKGVPDHFCAPGEVCGDPVSQLHKVAFEVFDPSKGSPAPGSPGATSAFLSCIGDKVNTYRPSEGRSWNNSEMSSRSQSPAIPDSPGSNGSATDYFSSGSPVDSSSLDSHGASSIPVSSDGGRVNTRRVAKRSNTMNSGPISKTTSKARRVRVNSVGSNGSAGGGGYVSSSIRYGLSEQSMSSGALWSIGVGESSVWTIVGTEQIRYNFYVPPNMPGARASGVPLKPVTPFPNVVKYLPPDRAAENPAKHGGVNRMLINSGMKPDPRNGPLLTIYGENFNKADPPLVFFGTEPSPFVDVRCQEVLACLPPSAAAAANGGPTEVPIKMEGSVATALPIFIARPDGVIYPSNVVFYGK